jgi:hypothetical protein
VTGKRNTMTREYQAVASRGRDIEEGHISTASCILANLAMQLGRPLTYDPSRRKVAGDPEATRLLKSVPVAVEALGGRPGVVSGARKKAD